MRLFQTVLRLALSRIFQQKKFASLAFRVIAYRVSKITSRRFRVRNFRGCNFRACPPLCFLPALWLAVMCVGWGGGREGGELTVIARVVGEGAANPLAHWAVASGQWGEG